MQLRLIAGFAAAGALVAGSIAATGERDYRAHAYVIRVPPAYGGKAGLDLARSGPVLRRALQLAERERRSTPGRPSAVWLARHSQVEHTGRGDFAIAVRSPDREQAAVLATAYAKAVKGSLKPQPGLSTRGRGARDAQRGLAPPGWALLGSAAGLWLGVAVAIVRTGSARGPRRASAPCPPGTRATPG